jgi:hypothetical protein
MVKLHKGGGWSNSRYLSEFPATTMAARASEDLQPTVSVWYRLLARSDAAQA